MELERISGKEVEMTYHCQGQDGWAREVWVAVFERK